jgi:hypothetical protein
MLSTLKKLFEQDFEDGESECNSIGIELANALTPDTRKSLCAPRVSAKSFCQSILLSESKSTDVRTRLYEAVGMKLKIFPVIKISYSADRIEDIYAHELIEDELSGLS